MFCSLARTRPLQRLPVQLLHLSSPLHAYALSLRLGCAGVRLSLSHPLTQCFYTMECARPLINLPLQGHSKVHCMTCMHASRGELHLCLVDRRPDPNPKDS